MEAITQTALTAPGRLSIRPAAAAQGEDESSFAGTLREALSEVNRLQREADQATLDLMSGDLDNLHQVLIKTEEAQLALQFTVQVVSKVLQAYQDISRMQV
ncbi:MAG: flagellar hook-basal body complex protein FliE [Bacillota bacterium]